MKNKDLINNKLQLSGFNNLTKSLGFNIYDFFYTTADNDRKFYLNYLDTYYSAEALRNILRKVAHEIGAHVLATSLQDYKPMGASVSLLIAEEENENTIEKESMCLLHLDKSHIVAHTYPDIDEATGVSVVRVDIDLATCGQVIPLSALDTLINAFKSNVVVLDYRVRGFTRDAIGCKHYLDHPIASIEDFISPDIKEKYDVKNSNLSSENIFYSKMIIKKKYFNHHYHFVDDLSVREKLGEKIEPHVVDRLYQEMMSIYNRKIN